VRDKSLLPATTLRNEVMSGVILLESILDILKPNYPAGLSDDDLFEFYCADNVLVNYDPDHAEIEAGIVDGPRDAGIDAAYVFINRGLLTDDFRFDSVKQPVDIELFVFQAKDQDTFKEGPVDKLSSSLPLLLDPNQQRAALEALFKKKVISVLHSSLDAMKKLAGEFPKIVIRIFIAPRATQQMTLSKRRLQALRPPFGTNSKPSRFLSWELSSSTIDQAAKKGS
jgi:hypothetical protein